MIKIMKFSAVWCGPCKTFAPVYDKVKAELESNEIEFQKVDVDKEGELAIQYAIMAVPTTVFLKDGKEVKRFPGTMDETEFKEMIAGLK